MKIMKRNQRLLPEAFNLEVLLKCMTAHTRILSAGNERPFSWTLYTCFQNGLF
jgi:hypothetical protein